MYRYAMCKRVIDRKQFESIWKVIDIAKKLGVEIIDNEEHISGPTTVEGFRALNFVVKATTETYIEFYKQVSQYPGFRHWQPITEKEFAEAHFFFTHPKKTLNESRGGLLLEHLYLWDEEFNEKFAEHLKSHTPSYYACEHVILPIEFLDAENDDDYIRLEIYGSPIFDFVALFNKRFPYCKPRAGQPYLNPDGWHVIPIVVRVFSQDEIEEVIAISGIQESDWTHVSETYYFQGLKLVEFKYPPLPLSQFIFSLEDKAQQNLRKQNER